MSTQDSRYVDVRGAAQEYAISRRTIWRWIGGGKLPAFCPFASRKLLVKRSDLEALIEGSRVHTSTRVER